MHNYDTMLLHHYTILGLVKYGKIPPNRILARVNYNYYMLRDRDGVAYFGNKGTMRMVADPDVVTRETPAGVSVTKQGMYCSCVLRLHGEA